ncbi:unnamed protein product [Arabidopsis halleri]
MRLGVFCNLSFVLSTAINFLPWRLCATSDMSLDNLVSPSSPRSSSLMLVCFSLAPYLAIVLLRFSFWSVGSF